MNRDCLSGDRMNPGILDVVWSSMRRRAGSCVEMHGKHIEHLLEKSHETSPISQQALVTGLC
jgi:hypothetical protein